MPRLGVQGTPRLLLLCLRCSLPPIAICGFETTRFSASKGSTYSRRSAFSRFTQQIKIRPTLRKRAVRSDAWSAGLIRRAILRQQRGAGRSLCKCCALAARKAGAQSAMANDLAENKIVEQHVNCARGIDVFSNDEINVR